MPARQWLESPDWQALQVLWLALQALAEHPADVVSWDILRLFVDRQLNGLQRLVMQHLLSVEQQRQLEALLHTRFDQVLEQLNRQRQQQKPYWVAPQHYRGPFSRYQALADLEIAFQRLQAELNLPQVPRQIRFQALHDLNHELLEKRALSQPVAEKAQVWQADLEHIVALAWRELPPDQALAEVLEQLPERDPVELAERVLKSTRFLQAQCSAVRVLGQRLTPQALAETLQPLLSYPETPARVSQEILAAVALDESWEPALLELIERPETSHELREQAIRKWRQLAQPQLVTRLLQTFQAARNWHPISRLLAIQALAHHGVYAGVEQVLAFLQEAARSDDARLLQAATEALVQLKEPQAVTYLLAVLNGQYRQETALERLQHAFLSERQEQYPFLVEALEKLGQPVEQEPLSGRWKKRET